MKDAIAAFERGDLHVARRLAERQLQASPSVHTLRLIGLIECRSGRIDSGIDWLERALAEDPDDSSVRVMLARALVDRGRHADALAVAEPPPGLSPPELALWHVRAEAADKAQAFEVSAQAWRVLADCRPDEWRVWANLGIALSGLSRWGEAAAALKRAVTLNPAELPLRRALATALARAGRFHESADELGAWVDSAPDDVATRLMFARLLADLGRGAESDRQLERAARIAGCERFIETADGLLSLARTPGEQNADVGLVRELAQLLERTNRREALATLLDAAEKVDIGRRSVGYPAAAAAFRDGQLKEARDILLANPDHPDAARWHRLMGRIADALGDPAAAFAEAEAMHRARSDLPDWLERGLAHLERVRTLTTAMTREGAAGVKLVQGDERNDPAFIVGFPRSGTTLLDTFLMGHPDSHVLEEVPLIGAVERVLGDPSELPGRGASQLGEARDAYFAELEKHVEPSFAGLAVDKLPLNLLAAPYFHAVFPKARFVFAQRHPCDVVLSCFMQDFALNSSMACFLDIETAAAYYDAAMRLWTTSNSLLPLDVHLVVYEELVENPEAALKPLVNFLGLDWSGGILDHRATAASRSGIATPSYDQVVQPLTLTPVGRWKRYEKQLEPVLPLLMPWVERLGYRG